MKHTSLSNLLDASIGLTSMSLTNYVIAGGEMLRLLLEIGIGAITLYSILKRSKKDSNV